MFAKASRLISCPTCRNTQYLKIPSNRGLGYTNRQKSTSTVDEHELARFNRLSDKWWDVGGPYSALHSMNRLRIPLIKSALTNSNSSLDSCPLDGFKILDVGCGGGLLSEPLSRLGAKVTGLDALQSNIDAAIDRMRVVNDERLDSKLEYVCSTVEEFAVDREGTYDAVVASEVVEHVNSLETFIASCVGLTKTGGSLVFTTINKTPLSYAIAIVAAENILHLAPRGTHDWHKFVPPEELNGLLKRNNCQQRLIHGMTINPVNLKWFWISNTDVNYATTFTKIKPLEHDSMTA